MKKIIIMALLILVARGGGLLAKESMILKVKVQTANVRVEPDSAAAIIARVPFGTLLESGNKIGVWYKVKVNDAKGKLVNGYIHANVVEVSGADEEEAEAEVKPRAAARQEVPRYRAAKEVSNPMRFGINFGIMTDDSFSFNPIMWTAGAELDFHIGDYIMFSPEVMLVGIKFEFKEFYLYPAAILNFTPGNFFIGGGLTKGFYIGSGTSGSTDFALKLNGGFLSSNIKLTAYLITAFDSLFKGMSVGATLGFRF